MLRHLRQALLSLIILPGLALASVNPDFARFSHDESLAYSQAAIGTRLEGVQLVDSEGNSVAIESYRGRPLVISMIYTSCHHVCPGTTQYLNEVVKKARSALDLDSFQVISVGFDTVSDSPERMAGFRQRTAVQDEHWDFLAGDANNMDTLTTQLGFIYYPSPKGFEHLVQSTLVDAEGVIYRHVYGMSFETPQLIEPLKDLVFDRPEAQSAFEFMENRIRLFCTVYDPATDSYHVDISVFIGTFVGIMVSILFGYVLVKEWRRSLRVGK